MPSITRTDVSAFTIPTDGPESDGTLAWESTTLVVVELEGGGRRGLGYTYADVATARLVQDRLLDVVSGIDAMDVPAAWDAMVRSIRNLGRPGIASMAIAAVDAAIWDLKARILEVPLAALLGAVRDRVPVYGSGGFTSYSARQLCDQLAGWVEAGIRSVKMKVGRDSARDVERVSAARKAIGPDVALFVDANGAYSRKEALLRARQFADLGVTWFEEPVPSPDLEGLRLIRDRGPAGMDITAGEYGYDLPYFRRMLAAGAVDVLQADATRCAGITGFLEAGTLCRAFGIPLSAHTAPALHAQPCCALASVRHLEYFHDHARIERMVFDGAPELEDGAIRPHPSRPGLGLELKRADAARYRA
jgi:L-alanine-DL-glutamate epimerase-like enolase superfamily enzyme